MASKRFVVVDETIGQVVSEELTEKQATDLNAVTGPASHTFTVQPAAEVPDDVDPVEPDPTG